MSVVRPTSRADLRQGPAPSQATWPVVAWTAAVAAAVAATAVARWWSGRAGIDLAVVDQQLWNASHGHAPLATTVGESLLGDHFSPGLLAFVAPYRLAATPVWLLVAQTAVVWVAVLELARRVQASTGPALAGLLGGVLLASPPVAYALLEDVHGETFAAAFAVLAVLAIDDDNAPRAWLFGLLTAAFRVEAGVAVLLALLVWPGLGSWRRRLAACLAAYLAVAVALELRLGGVDYWAAHYARLGSSPVDALAHPGRTAAVLLSAQTLIKATPWVVAAGGLCLRQPRRAVPALAVALPVLLSGWWVTALATSYYGIAPTLLLVAAGLAVLAREPRLAWLVVAANLVLALVLGPLPPSVIAPYGRAGFFWAAARLDSERRCVTEGIPAGAAVAATPEALALLAHREQLYVWPYPFKAAPFNPWAWPATAAGDPGRAAQVAYVVVARTAQPPAGFTVDRDGPTLVRYRRTATPERTTPTHC